MQAEFKAQLRGMTIDDIANSFINELRSFYYSYF